MNRRLIVQFDPDEPSMSAPTFAEPDQGPLAGGRKVNARHDLTLGLWRRDCEISRGFRDGDALADLRARGCGRSQRHCRSREVPPQGLLDPDPYRKANGGAQDFRDTETNSGSPNADFSF